MKKIILILLLLSGYCYSQSGWFWQNPLPSGNMAYDMTSTSSNTIFIATTHQGLFKSTDLGSNWQQGACASLNHYNSVQFINPLTGFAAGNYTLVKTTDGGNNWQSISTVYNGFNKIYFLNDNTGFNLNAVGMVYVTTNAGNNWINLNTNGVTIRDFFVFDLNNFICIGDLQILPKILKTTNGGLNWIIYTGSTGIELIDIHFADLSTGFAAGNNQNNNSYILKTTDGGINWSGQSITSSGRIMKIQCINNNTVYALATNGYFLTSSNSGVNWNLTQFDLTNYSNMSMHFVNSSTGFIDGYLGRLFKTTNSGNNWTFITKGSYTPLQTVFFADSLNGFAGGNSSTIIKTTDSGKNWVTGSLNLNYTINSLYFISRDTGFAACDSGKLYKTVNSGNNWTSINVNTQFNLLKVFFIDQSTGFVGGKNGFLSRTTNKGIIWQTVGSFPSFSISGICSSNANTVYLAGGGYIFKSINNGINWSMSAGIPANLKDISFANSDTGSVTGYYLNGFQQFLTAYTTFNGGVTWNRTYSSFGCCPASVKYFNSQKGCIVSPISFLLTTNSGASWFLKSDLPSFNIAYGSFFLDSNTGYVVGDYGMILKTTDGGGNIILGTSNSGTNIPKNFRLSQNYPNPFNPSTKIKFDVPKTSLIKIVVYDLLGREVTTLVNEELTPGTYQADWDASNYSSGIYFYKITAGEFTETKKMVLMK